MNGLRRRCIRMEGTTVQFESDGEQNEEVDVLPGAFFSLQDAANPRSELSFRSQSFSALRQ